MKIGSDKYNKEVMSRALNVCSFFFFYYETDKDRDKTEFCSIIALAALLEEVTPKWDTIWFCFLFLIFIACSRLCRTMISLKI